MASKIFREYNLGVNRRLLKFGINNKLLKIAMIIGLIFFTLQLLAIIYPFSSTAINVAFNDYIQNIAEIFSIGILFFVFNMARKLGKHSTVSWGLISVSLVFILIGDLNWTYIETILMQNPFSSIINIFNSLFYLLLLIGLLWFPRDQFSADETLKFIIDIGILLLSTGLFFWLTLIHTLYVKSVFMGTLTLLYLLFDSIILFVIFNLLFQKFRDLDQIPRLILVVALFSILIYDIMFTYMNLLGIYNSAGPSEIFWMSFVVLIGISGIFQIYEWKNEHRTLPHFDLPLLEKLKIDILKYLPLASVVAAYTMLIWVYYYNPAELSTFITVNAIILGLVIIHQILNTNMNKNVAKTVFKSSPEAMLITSLSGEIMDMNPSANNLYGISSSKQYSNMNLINLIQEDYRFIAAQNIDKLIKTGSLQDVEYLFLKDDGNCFPGDMSIGIIRDIAGKPKNMIVTIKDITKHKTTENEIKKSLEQKTTLLREIHHRVKNNLQIISSLLSLQSEYIGKKDTLEVLNDAKVKVYSIATVHKLLYQTLDFSIVDFGKYVKELGIILIKTYSPKGDIKLDVNANDINLDLDTAIPCGLIITELITNSLKYAFPDGQDGIIIISIKKDAEYYYLTVSDDGIGLPADFDILHTEGLGLKVVNMLVKQLDGEIHLDPNEKTHFSIKFKVPEKK